MTALEVAGVSMLLAVLLAVQVEVPGGEEMRLVFKNEADRELWNREDTKPQAELRLLVHEARQFLLAKGEAFVITSYRHGRASGPHADGRAVDLRSVGMDYDTKRELVEFLNEHFPSDWQHTAIFEAPPGAGYGEESRGAFPVINPNASAEHFHLQVERFDIASRNWRPVLTAGMFAPGVAA